MSGGGSGTNTVTQQSGPPQQYLDAYSNVFGQAQNVASTQNAQYPGQTVAGLSPDQSAGITGVENAYGMSAPYINSAAQYINNSTTPLAPGVQPYVDQAAGYYGDQAGYASQAAGIYGGLTNGLSQGQIQQYQSPYTQDVVNATQAQFNNQNAIQQNQLAGQAGTSGAFGGDRQGVAAGVLGGQQQLAQAPVIAGLENQGYSQALQEANQQQQVQAGAAQGLLGAGAGTGAAGAGVLGASGQLLGANEANSWLNSQAGYGMANLGNAAQTSALTGSNALLGVGGLEQQQAQSELNVPYEQYLAQQAYPFQSTGWLANIAEGLGGASGGNSSTTSPGASVGSQIAGAGLAGVGILGQTGAFGSNGYLTGAGGLFGSSLGGAGTTTATTDALGNAIGDGISIARGGMVPHRAPGGALVSNTPPAGMSAPVSSAPAYGMSLPDAQVSIVPGSSTQMGNVSGHPGSNLLKTSTGSTTTTTGGGNGDSTFGDILKAAGGIAAGIYGGPAGALAASALSSQVHFARGGGMQPVNDNWSGGWPEPEQKRASGGTTQVTIAPGSYAGSPGVPQVSMAPPTSLTPAAMGPGNPGVTPAMGAAALSSNPSVQTYLGNTLAGASFAPPPVYQAPAPAAAPASATGVDPALQAALANFFSPTGNPPNTAMSGQGTGAHGGAVSKLARGGIPHRADGGTYGGDESPPNDPDMHGMAPAVPGQTDNPWDMSSGAPHGMGASRPMGVPNGPPAPPPPAGSGMQAPTGAGAKAAPTPTPSGSSPWSMLTDVGLGIMGGTSPNALTNVGRGALQGLKQADVEKQADAATAYRQQALNETGRHNLVDEQTAAVQLSDKAQQALAALKLKDREVGVQEGNAAETVREHDLQNTQRQDAINLGKYTYQNVTQPDPNDPTKTISGVNKLDMTGKEPPTFIPTMTDPNKNGQAGGLGGREGVYFSRVAAAGNEAGLAIKNITELPLDTSTGWWGGAQQGTGLLSAVKTSLANKLTPQSVQDYNTMIAGVSRNLATIESAGLAPSGTLTHSMDSLTLKEGDTPLTQMRKLAEMRQTLEKGLEPNLSNPKLPQQQRDLVIGIIKNVQQAVPFTQHDLTMFQQKGKPGETLSSYASGNNLGNAGQQSQSQPSGGGAGVAPQWKYSATGAKGLKAYSVDGKTWFNQDGSPIGGP